MLNTYHDFAQRAAKSKRDLLDFLQEALAKGKTIAALGASTKGNVLLQYCGLTENEISYIGEVNEDKFGCYTPGSWIPIIPEQELLARRPDYVIVLPWHFRQFFETNPRLSDLRLIYPLPHLDVSDALAC
jgi:ABC-type Fe3+-hydroxamate transport system substrate-binding protein